MRFLARLAAAGVSLWSAATLAIDFGSPTRGPDEPVLLLTWDRLADGRAGPSLIDGRTIPAAAVYRACLGRAHSGADRLAFFPRSARCVRVQTMTPAEQFKLQRVFSWPNPQTKSQTSLWEWHVPVSPDGVCTCPTGVVPVVMLDAGAQQTVAVGTPISEIIFSAVEPSAAALSIALDHSLNEGPRIEGLPGGLASTCQTDANATTCTVSGTAPIAPGAYRIRLTATNAANLAASAEALLNAVVQPASISGVLTRESDGEGIAGALMLLYRPDQGSLEAGSAITDAQGRYEFVDLEPATYTVGTFGLDAFGLLNELYDNVECALGCDPSVGTPIVLGSGNNRSDINIAAAAAGTIAGRVTRADNGLPIVETVVNTLIVNSNGTLAGAGIGFTDADGFYQVSGLPTGTYKVGLGQLFDAQVQNAEGVLAEVFDNVQCPCLFADGDDVSVTEDSTTDNVDFVLENAPFEVSGRVTDALTGAPIGGVEMQIVEQFISGFDEPAINQAGKKLTDADGRYQFFVPAGDYVVSTNAAALGYIDEWFDDLRRSDVLFEEVMPLPISADRTDIDFALDPGSAIEGRVTRADSGAGVAPLLMVAENIDTNAAFTVETQPDGSYLIDGMAPGSYRVSVFSASGFNLITEVYDNVQCQPCDDIAGTPVEVIFGETTSGINFVLDTGGGIAGRVSALETGDNLPNILVLFFDRRGAAVGQAFADVNGQYILQGLLPGDYRVMTTRAGAFSLINELYEDIPCIGGCDPTTGQPVTISAGSPRQGIDFSLGPVPVLVDDTPVDLDALGQSIVIAGERLIVGSPGDDTLGADAGAVVVFALVEGQYQRDAQIVADDGAEGDRFGSVLAASRTTLAVGAPQLASFPEGQREPAVYLFSIGPGFMQQQRLEPFNLSGSGYATALALQGDRLAVGAPNATKAASDAAGPAGTAAAGAVLIFERQADLFVPLLVLADPDGTSGDEFGAAVTFSDDQVLIGAPGKGDSGRVLVFDLSPGKGLPAPIEIAGSGVGSGDRFGAALSSDDGFLVVGAPDDDAASENAGAAYVFDLLNPGFPQTRKVIPLDPALDPSDPNALLGSPDGGFGSQLQLSGSSLVVGAAGEAQAAGASYVFTADDETGARWTLSDRLTRESGRPGDRLGASVAVADGVLAAGAPNAESEGVAAGVVLGAATDRNPLFGDGFEEPVVVPAQ